MVTRRAVESSSETGAQIGVGEVGEVSVMPRRGPGRPPKGGRVVTALRGRTGHGHGHARRGGTGLDRYLPEDVREEMQRRVYRPEDFHVAVSDEQGHDRKVGGIRFHPLMANELNMIIARGNFPISTEVDLIRNAVFEYIQKLYELERAGGVPNYIARLKAINRLSLQSQQNREFEDTLRTVNEEVRKLLDKNRREAAAMFVHDVLQEAKQIPQKSWREYYVDSIQRDYGHLLKEQRKSVKVNRREE
jgi:hypothetical protein